MLRRVTDRARKDYLRAHKTCEYCAALGTIRRATTVVPRQFGEKAFFVALCEDHFERIKEIEGEGCYDK